MATVFDVASYILGRTDRITTWKLQKLVYYSQAWSLVWDEEPLFSEDIQAWANGPVVKELYMDHRGEYEISELSRGDPEILTDTQEETIDAVLKYYGDKTSQWLSDLTHNEDPWKNARIGLEATTLSHRVISHDAIAQYYLSLE